MKDKKPLQSKKFIALAVGISFTSLFTLVSLIMIGMVPNASSSIVNLMTVSLAAVNGVIGLYTVGQSGVDWKINSQHNTTQETKTNEEIRRVLIQEGKEKEMKYDGISESINWDRVSDDDLKRGMNFNFNINKDVSQL